MDRESDLDEAVSVSEGDVTVEKSFALDDFPVPAVTFTITSIADESNHVRLVDRIPDSFPMERVGFHPDYDSGHWTAYKDHRVVYERMFSPGESVTTVYGVRIDDDTDPSEFLQAPLLQQRPSSSNGEFETIDGILGRDDGVVRDLLAGDRPTDPDEGTGELPFETDPATSEPDGDARTGADSDAIAAALGDAVEDDAGGSADSGSDDVSADDVATAFDAEVDVQRDAAGAGAPAERPTDAVDDASAIDEASAIDDSEESVEDAAELIDDGVESIDVDGDSVVAALAAEIRDGGVADEDLAVLRRELDAGVPRSVDVRIRRLQGQVSDVAAYSDALSEFLDEEGTGTEVIDDLRGEVESVSTELDDLRAAVTDAESDRADVRADVEDVATDVEAVGGRLDDHADRLESIEAEVVAATDRAAAADEAAETALDRIETIESAAAARDQQFDDLEEELGGVCDDVAALDGELLDARESVDEEIEALREDVRALESKLSDVESFRDRLTDVFGPAGSDVNAE